MITSSKRPSRIRPRIVMDSKATSLSSVTFSVHHSSPPLHCCTKIRSLYCTPMRIAQLPCSKNALSISMSSNRVRLYS